ncbi:hypothetical protein HYH03_018302 [Edaphochlamys debaryana]|uniref:Uncharacterized protein n=1 Tax=Edaphochlamys debaryana TaxID=47281 RepID=A0A835XE02_9CHLO|nr:hypothetical protein HYH03_018302 [Edaphochlamys debaryana]|eukprot:KAG2482762.1 hypothetical protein HYH03_018302 [Edaphochlamys debaryana]
MDGLSSEPGGAQLPTDPTAAPAEGIEAGDILDALGPVLLEDSASWATGLLLGSNAPQLPGGSAHAPPFASPGHVRAVPEPPSPGFSEQLDLAALLADAGSGVDQAAGGGGGGVLPAGDAAAAGLLAGAGAEPQQPPAADGAVSPQAAGPSTSTSPAAAAAAAVTRRRTAQAPRLPARTLRERVEAALKELGADPAGWGAQAIWEVTSESRQVQQAAREGVTLVLLGVELGQGVGLLVVVAVWCKPDVDRVRREGGDLQFAKVGPDRAAPQRNSVISTQLGVDEHGRVWWAAAMDYLLCNDCDKKYENKSNIPSSCAGQGHSYWSLLELRPALEEPCDSIPTVPRKYKVTAAEGGTKTLHVLVNPVATAWFTRGLFKPTAKPAPAAGPADAAQPAEASAAGGEPSQGGGRRGGGRSPAELGGQTGAAGGGRGGARRRRRGRGGSQGAAGPASVEEPLGAGVAPEPASARGHGEAAGVPRAAAGGVAAGAGPGPLAGSGGGGGGGGGPSDWVPAGAGAELRPGELSAVLTSQRQGPSPHPLMAAAAQVTACAHAVNPGPGGGAQPVLPMGLLPHPAALVHAAGLPWAPHPGLTHTALLHADLTHAGLTQQYLLLQAQLAAGYLQAAAATAAVPEAVAVPPGAAVVSSAGGSGLPLGGMAVAPASVAGPGAGSGLPNARAATATASVAGSGLVPAAAVGAAPMASWTALVADAAAEGNASGSGGASGSAGPAGPAPGPPLAVPAAPAAQGSRPMAGGHIVEVGEPWRLLPSTLRGAAHLGGGTLPPALDPGTPPGVAGAAVALGLPPAPVPFKASAVTVPAAVGARTPAMSAPALGAADSAAAASLTNPVGRSVTPQAPASGGSSAAVSVAAAPTSATAPPAAPLPPKKLPRLMSAPWTASRDHVLGFLRSLPGRSPAQLTAEVLLPEWQALLTATGPRHLLKMRGTGEKDGGQCLAHWLATPPTHLDDLDKPLSEADADSPITQDVAVGLIVAVVQVLGPKPWRKLLGVQDAKHKATPLHRVGRFGHRLRVVVAMLRHASRSALLKETRNGWFPYHSAFRYCWDAAGELLLSATLWAVQSLPAGPTASGVTEEGGDEGMSDADSEAASTDEMEESASGASAVCTGQVLSPLQHRVYYTLRNQWFRDGGGQASLQAGAAALGLPPPGYMPGRGPAETDDAWQVAKAAYGERQEVMRRARRLDKKNHVPLPLEGPSAAGALRSALGLGSVTV